MLPRMPVFERQLCLSLLFIPNLLSIKHLRFGATEPAKALSTYDLETSRIEMEKKWRIFDPIFLGCGVNSVSVLV